MGVISAGRARLSKRGVGGGGRASEGGLRRKGFQGREKRGRGDGPTVCLSARPRCPGRPAPAAVRNSHKMAAWPGQTERLRREEGRGGRGHREAEAVARSGGGRARAAVPEGRRKEPREAEGRRKEPNGAEREPGERRKVPKAVVGAGLEGEVGGP